MASSSPSAVDMAAAMPPAATRPEITYGRPAISGVARTTMSGRMKNSLICRMPSLLPSVTASIPTDDHCLIHSRFCTCSMDLPMIAVARFGSNSCSLVSVAKAGAVKYSRKMKNSDQDTERRAERTVGVVK